MLNDFMMWLYRIADYAFVWDWEDVPPEERPATLGFLATAGVLIGTALILAVLWIDSVML